MTFTLRQLQIFVEAAADQNFRVTADRLDICQPSVSNHIGALERSTGLRLFERQRGTAARLSAAGRDLLTRAKLLLQEASEVGISPLPRSGKGSDYVLRIAAGHYLVDQWIRLCLPAYFAQGNVPGVEIKLASPSEEMLDLLRGGHVDAAFYTGRTRPRHADLSAETLRRVTSSLYGTPELVAPLGVDPGKVGAAPMIMLPTGSSYDRSLRARLAAARIHPRRIVARSEFTDVSLELALRGIGLAMLFDEQVAQHVAAGRLARIPIDFEPGYRLMLTRRGYHEPRARVPLDYLRKCLQQARPGVPVRRAPVERLRSRPGRSA